LLHFNIVGLNELSLVLTFTKGGLLGLTTMRKRTRRVVLPYLSSCIAVKQTRRWD